MRVSYIRPDALTPHLHFSQSPHHVRRSQPRDHVETTTENQQEDDGARHGGERKEVDDFDVDAFLDVLFPPREDKKDQQDEDDHEAAPLLQNPDTPECPRCHVLLEYHESPRSDGTVWRYVRCPESKFFTKCFVTCGVDNQLDTYLAIVRHQLHEAYRHTSRSLDMAQLRCFCCKSLVLCLSHSEKTPHRLYIKCPQGTCGFFQWGDQPPSGKVERWLEQGIHPDWCPERSRPPSPLYALGTRRQAPYESQWQPKGSTQEHIRRSVARERRLYRIDPSREGCWSPLSSSPCKTTSVSSSTWKGFKCKAPFNPENSGITVGKGMRDARLSFNASSTGIWAPGTERPWGSSVVRFTD